MTANIEIPLEKWAGKVREVTLGASRQDGGTRSKVVTIGGEVTLPFLHFEGKNPNSPALAIEIHDIAPNWSAALKNEWQDVWNDVSEWCRRAELIGADVIALYLSGTHPDGKNLDAGHAVETVRKVLNSTGLPLIVLGPGTDEKDNEVLAKVAEAAAGEKLTLGICEQDNYRTIAGAALAYGHNIIARAPIDVNIQKQLNILLNDLGLPMDRVIMDPSIGPLGYGLEYAYSVMERLRLAALQGDSMTQMPMLCTGGEEVWKTKEAIVGEETPAAWGDLNSRGIGWETATAMAMLESGADLLLLRHPLTLQIIRKTIEKLTL